MVLLMDENIKVKQHCSLHFTYQMLFHCSTTWQSIMSKNLPKQESSWQAYKNLAVNVLDPLVEHFGIPFITYGFSSNELTASIRKKLKPNISPPLDQHSACELNKNGNLICPRQGAAVDLIYPNISSFKVAIWLANNTPFDRLYIYGDERPLHVSYGPEDSRKIVLLETKNNKQIPRTISLEKLKGMSKC